MTTVNADFFSEGHRISGRIEIGSAGLIGLLNDTTTSLADIEDVYLSRLQQPAKIMAHSATTSLTKANVALVILRRREDLGSPAVARSGYTRLLSHSVLVMLPAFEVRGLAELPGKLDARALVVEGSGRFFALYQATAVATLFPETPYSGEVILVNRSLVTSVVPLAEGKT